MVSGERVKKLDENLMSRKDALGLSGPVIEIDRQSDRQRR